MPTRVSICAMLKGGEAPHLNNREAASPRNVCIGYWTGTGKVGKEALMKGLGISKIFPKR